MSLQPAVIQQFAGLDLISDPPESGAIDMLNVDLNQRGRVRTRDGSTRLGSSTLTGTTPSLLTATSFSGTEQLIGLSTGVSGPTTTGYLDKFTTAGVRTQIGNWIISNGGAGGYVVNTVRFGTPTSELVYISAATPTSGAVTAIQKYNGATLTGGTGFPTYIALLPASNRLAQANFSSAANSPTAANGSPSTVFFSDAGLPDTYSANNYVHLQPGDGEAIIGMYTWREMLFVFKQRTLFVFYGTSVAATGQPIFNYRTVSLPAKLEPQTLAKNPVTVGTDGVYFFGDGTIYRTTGGQPTTVSDPVEPILKRWTSATLNYGGTAVELSWLQERLYVRYTPESGSNPLVLVYDTRGGYWLLWQFGDNTNTGQRIACDFESWQGRPYYVNAAGRVMFVDPAATQDDSTNFAAYYQSGWLDFGTPADKRVSDFALWGSGSPTLSVFSDRGSTDTSAAAVTLGVSPAVLRTVQSKARRGRQLSWKLSSTSGAWNVSSIELYMADQRVLP